MRRALLFFLFLFISQLSFSQQNDDCADCPTVKEEQADQVEKDRSNTLHVYPNPAEDYIKLSNSKNVAFIYIHNMIGKKVATLKVKEQNYYSIARLRKGMYLIQLISTSNTVLHTQRFNKK